MAETTAFERQVADEMLRRAGPVRPVDDLAVFDAVVAATRSPRWRLWSTPMPSAKGDSAMITGRTQAMFTPFKAIVAGALTFALLGVLSIAQPFDQQGATVPGAPVASPSPSAPVAAAVARTDGSARVTGTVVSVASNASNLDFAEEGVSGEDYVGHGRGSSARVGFEWSDPRLPSQAEMIGNFEYYGSEADGDVGAQVTINMWRLEDAEGSWSGPWTGWSDEQDRWHGTVVLTGHGAYEGLYAVLTERPQEDPDGTVTKVLEGAILAGEMPPMPEPTTE